MYPLAIPGLSHPLPPIDFRFTNSSFSASILPVFFKWPTTPADNSPHNSSSVPKLLRRNSTTLRHLFHHILVSVLLFTSFFERGNIVCKVTSSKTTLNHHDSVWLQRQKSPKKSRDNYLKLFFRSHQELNFLQTPKEIAKCS